MIILQQRLLYRASFILQIPIKLVEVLNCPVYHCISYLHRVISDIDHQLIQFIL